MEIALALVKLALGLAAFTLIGYIGTRDKRVTGILLTFPILNGIAILTAADPFAVARPIYPLAMFNTVLFAVVITWCALLPPLAARTPENAKVVLRVAIWTLAWLAAASLLTLGRDRLPSPWVLFLVQLGVGVLFVSRYWTRARPAAPVPGDTPRGFFAFWSSGAAMSRIALFIAAFAILLAVSYRFESHWIGMASSLPLPGLFAIATLSVTQPDLRAIRDTVFLGPLLVIPFNESFAFAVSHLPRGASGVPIGIAVLIGMWVVAAVLVFLFVPKFACWLDRRRRG